MDDIVQYTYVSKSKHLTEIIIECVTIQFAHDFYLYIFTFVFCFLFLPNNSVFKTLILTAKSMIYVIYLSLQRKVNRNFNNKINLTKYSILVVFIYIKYILKSLFNTTLKFSFFNSCFKHEILAYKELT